MQEGALTATELAQLADEYGAARAARLAADKVANEAASKEDKLKSKLMEQLQLQKLTSVGGSKHTVSIPVEPDYVPAVKDWQAYWNYAKENNAPEMFERRAGKLACRERWEAGETIPGVEKFPVYKLTVKGVK